MLTYDLKKGLLYSNQEIQHADSIIELKSTVEASFVGVLELSNGLKKINNFVKLNNSYQMRLQITLDDLPYIKDNSFYIEIINSKFISHSLPIKFNFNFERIQQEAKIKREAVFDEYNQRLIKLEELIAQLTKKGIIKDLAILNQETIQPGMIPVAIEGGGFAAMYPFVDIVREINGLKAVNEKITITPKDIKYNDGYKTVDDMLKLLLELVGKQSEAIKFLIQAQTDLNEELKILKLAFAEHTTSTIV